MPFRLDTRAKDCAALALILAVGTIIYGWIAIGGTTITSFSDSMDYLFLADFYRDAMGGTFSETFRDFYRVTRFPPVFSMLLAAFGGGAENQHAAFIVSCTTAVLAAACVWTWVRIESGLRQATPIALALLLYPAYFLVNLSPVSEPLGIAFLCLALALLAGPEPKRNRIITAALVIGLAPLVRTALLPLIPAFAIWLWIGRPMRRPALIAVLALATAPLALWTVYRRLLGSASYADALSFAQLVDGWGGWPDALWLQPTRMFRQLVENWGVDPNPVTIIVSAILVLLAFAGCILRLRKNKLDAWFLAGYVAMILAWPFPDHFWRFLVVAYPVLLVSAATTLAWLQGLRRDAQARAPLHPALAFTALLVLATAPAAARYLHRAMLPVNPAIVGEKRERSFFWTQGDPEALATAELYARIRLASREVRNLVGQDQCVYSVFPQSLALHGPVSAVLYPLGLDPDVSAERSLTECDYYFISGFSAIELKRPPLFPHKALEGWTEPVLVSRFTLPDGRTITAAALARRKR